MWLLASVVEMIEYLGNLIEGPHQQPQAEALDHDVMDAPSMSLSSGLRLAMMSDRASTSSLSS
ncbi:uncharacterized protein PHALS_04641 [Plasmopara halstedii]|uniref:Uncharacterized protein n=1 Tax=Plasmopara halstedii TaxID=4781 RepID=A0A0P1AAE0_PLAHL|nr:uncharacterized protein PHALS_04641 [Plasmopara halstedii]CEG37196.1 hypothetical protein PHALS_04641 [Plasmopara halstedii]|eukprot:XP_024573565.1 hypothetical protein PHALS_04641 [Plasmopara halstedii]